MLRSMTAETSLVNGLPTLAILEVLDSNDELK